MTGRMLGAGGHHAKSAMRTHVAVSALEESPDNRSLALMRSVAQLGSVSASRGASGAHSSTVRYVSSARSSAVPPGGAQMHFAARNGPHSKHTCPLRPRVRARARWRGKCDRSVSALSGRRRRQVRAHVHRGHVGAGECERVTHRSPAESTGCRGSSSGTQIRSAPSRGGRVWATAAASAGHACGRRHDRGSGRPDRSGTRRQSLTPQSTVFPGWRPARRGHQRSRASPQRRPAAWPPRRRPSSAPAAHAAGSSPPSCARASRSGPRPRRAQRAAACGAATLWHGAGRPPAPPKNAPKRSTSAHARAGSRPSTCRRPVPRCTRPRARWPASPTGSPPRLSDPGEVSTPRRARPRAVHAARAVVAAGQMRRECSARARKVPERRQYDARAAQRRTRRKPQRPPLPAFHPAHPSSVAWRPPREKATDGARRIACATAVLRRAKGGGSENRAGGGGGGHRGVARARRGAARRDGAQRWYRRGACSRRRLGSSWGA